MVERIVMSYTPIPFISTATWTLVHQIGIGAAPFIYLLASALAYYGIQLPRVSSLSDERNKLHGGDNDASEKNKKGDDVTDDVIEKYLTELSAGCKSYFYLYGQL